MDAVDVLNLMWVVEDLKARSSKGFIPFSSVTIDNKLEFSDYIIFDDCHAFQSDSFPIVYDMVVDEIHHDIVSRLDFLDGLVVSVRVDEEDDSHYLELRSENYDDLFIIENGEFYRV